jgi:hypothetical protein
MMHPNFATFEYAKIGTFDLDVRRMAPLQPPVEEHLPATRGGADSSRPWRGRFQRTVEGRFPAAQPAIRHRSPRLHRFAKTQVPLDEI